MSPRAAGAPYRVPGKLCLSLDTIAISDNPQRKRATSDYFSITSDSWNDAIYTLDYTVLNLLKFIFIWLGITLFDMVRNYGTDVPKSEINTNIIWANP